MIKENTLSLRVRRESIKGFSGIKHDVDIVEYEGRKYIYILIDRDVKLSIDNNYSMIILAKLLISHDTRIPPLAIVKRGVSVNSSLINLIKELGGMILYS